MAADPTLADRIKRAEANLDQLHSDLHDQECLMPLQDQWLTEARTTMEAAAVRLRKLDAIDPSELRRLSEALVDWSSDPGPDELAEASIVLSRIADALGPGGE